MIGILMEKSVRGFRKGASHTVIKYFKKTQMWRCCTIKIKTMQGSAKKIINVESHLNSDVNLCHLVIVIPRFAKDINKLLF